MQTYPVRYISEHAHICSVRIACPHVLDKQNSSKDNHIKVGK